MSPNFRDTFSNLEIRHRPRVGQSDASRQALRPHGTRTTSYFWSTHAWRSLGPSLVIEDADEPSTASKPTSLRTTTLANDKAR